MPNAISYRTATTDDAGSIAALHARSWQETYRGILPDTFLDHEVEAERLAYWQEQFCKSPQPLNRHSIVAEAAGELIGFACVLANHDSTYGALLDNLHVSSAHKGWGIGRNLIKQAAEWAQHRDASFYLWVYEENGDARKFYESLGATNQETVSGEYAMILRYVWPNVQTLISTQ